VECLAAIDAGTGSGRCVVFDAAGRQLASAQEPFRYGIVQDPDLPMVRGFDLDAAAVWDILARCVRTALAALPADARVVGVVGTAQREGCVILDAGGAVLYAGPNLDARAVREGMELQQVVTMDRLHALTGHAPPYIFPLARWLWFQRHRDADRAASLLMLNDWIAYRLCGARVAEHSNAAETMLYDVTRRAWCDEIIDAFAVPRRLLPELVAAGTRVGAVSPDAAAATGLPAGTPVFAGGADTESALLGSGAWEAGVVGTVLGTTTPVQVVVESAVLDPAGNLWTSPHVVADRWVVESNAGDTGSAWRWLLELVCGGDDAAAHARAEAEMATVDAAPRPMFVHLGPAIFDLRTASPFMPAGLLFRFPLLHIDRPTRADLLRAFLENVAFAIRGNVEQIARLVPLAAGAPLRVSGGLTRSPTLLRVLAATLGAPLEVAHVTDSASLGSAMLAAVGAGLHRDVAAAVDAMARVRTVEPDRALVPQYADRYARWRELYDTFRTWTLT
jgi:sugar (pentulose or hexulose) kinase